MLIPERSSPARRPGAAIIEFAFVSMIIFVFFFGFVEFGRIYMVKHLTFQAARAACREGIYDGVSTATVTGIANNRLADYGINSATVTVEVNGTNADASTADSDDRITVIIAVPYAANSWLPAASYYTGDLTSEITLRRE